MDDKTKIKDIYHWVETLKNDLLFEDDDEITEKKVDVLEEIMGLCNSYLNIDENNIMKDKEFKEFKNFDNKPEITYLVTGERPFNEDDYWSEEETDFYTFEKAIEQAEIFSKKYHDVYITKQFTYTYQRM
jgi:hypothetical protein